jgi:hypothetical protein
MKENPEEKGKGGGGGKRGGDCGEIVGRRAGSP